MKVFTRRFCAAAASAALVFSQLGMTAWADDNKQDNSTENIAEKTNTADDKVTTDDAVTDDETVTDYETGDVNGDSNINVTDIALVASHIKGIKALDKSGAKAADIDEDDNINVTDISMIAAHIKGIKSIGWEKTLEKMSDADIKNEPQNYTKLADVFAAKDKVSVNWDAADGAMGYAVTCIAGGNERDADTISGRTAKLLPDNVGDAQKVTFRIKPYKIVNTETQTAIRTYLDGMECDVYIKPEGVTSDIGFEVSVDKIKAHWEAAKGADCYDVYLSANGSEKLLERSEDTSCEFECSPSTGYTVKVVSVKKLTIDGKETELKSETEKTGSVTSRPVYAKAKNKLDQIGWDIRAAYNWSTTLIDSNTGLNVDGSSGMEWYADYGFDNNRGNCYVDAACLCEMALMMGYDAHLVSGFYKNDKGDWVDHAWVEIDNYAGTDQTFIMDPYFRVKTGRSGFELQYGDPGSWDYDYYGEYYKHRMN